MEDSQFEDDPHEQELANLLTQIADQIAGGVEVDINKVCDDHPELAEDIRELMGTMVVTQAAGSGSVSSVPTDSKFASLELPYEMEKFVLEEELGRGGMGIVYRAYRKSDGKSVAIKMLLRGEFASPVEKQRFETEVTASMQLNHPNIVPIYDYGEHKGNGYFCMKLIEGETLTQRLLRGPLTAKQTARLMLQVSEAIHYAHEQGILHRDLKPSNILLDGNDRPYVADFGLAKQFTGDPTLTRSGAILGTPSYMAPEQAAGRRGDVGVISDVYSLGAILYHVLTGHPPFQAASPVDTLLLVLEQDPVPPRVLNRRVHRKLEMITMRCLQKPQDLRYETAEKMAEDLAAVLDNRSIAAQEGRIGKIIVNVFRETHHASVLENWGLLWIWHSLVLLIACVGTNVMYLMGVETRWLYSLTWSVGFGAWGGVFWLVRRRMGPVTFIERQVAHVWAASLVCVFLLFPFEGFLGLPLLRLAPVMCMVAAMTFLIKAGSLSGLFYIQAAVLFVTAFLMGLVPRYALILFGLVSFGCFFFPGVKYYQQRLKTNSMNPNA